MVVVFLPLVPDTPKQPLSVAQIYRDHREFLWLSLYRLGVMEADLPDAMQEVLVVVHRRLSSFNGSGKLTSWLFGICLRVAAAQRRRAYVRREQVTSDPEQLDTRVGDEQPALALDARRRLEHLLGVLKLEQRAVFVMFELEGLSSLEISEQLSIPQGTVHSRLHKARKAFKAALVRLEWQEAHQLGVRRGVA